MPPSRTSSESNPGSLLAWQILAPVAALFFALLLLSGFAARNYFEPAALQREMQRAEADAKFAAVVFSQRLPQADPRRLAELFRASGLESFEFFAPDQMPRWSSPRYVAIGPYVEAWAPVQASSGSMLGAISLRRQADALLFVTRAIQAFAIASCAVFALLAFAAWFLIRRRVSRRLRAVAREIAPGAAGVRTGTDAIEEVRLAAVEALAQARERERPLRRLLEGHSEMACASTAEGKILDVNEAYCRFFGKPREQLVGSNYLDLIPPSDRSEALASVQKLSRTNPVNFSEHRVLLPDGSTRWMRWRDTAVVAADGTVGEILSYGSDISAEKNLGEQIDALKVAFAQMQSLAETGSLTWDLGRDVMEWTKETRRLLGMGETAPASLDALLEVIAPEDREKMNRLFRAAREEGKEFEHEFRAILPDGSVRVLQSCAEVLADPKTKVLNNLTCTLRDITALRDAEAATKRELRFREAIEQSLAAGIVVSDQEGRNLLVNPAFCQMTGFAPEELLGITAPYPYWPKEEIPAINRAFELAIAGQTPPQGFELKFCRKDGSRFDVLVKVAPLLENDDRRMGWLGAITDISALQETRRQLSATNERLRIAQDVAEFGIWDWDPNADTLYWDENSFAIFGHPGETDAGKVWAEAIPYEERERLTYELKRLIAAEGKSGQDRLVARRPDGSLHDVLSTYVVLRDESGRALRVLGINRDITAELEQEREFRNANERLVAALEGGSFGTFEHIYGIGAVNWNSANYEIHGIDRTITDPEELFQAWRTTVGESYPAIEHAVTSLPRSQNFVSYDFDIRSGSGGEKKRVRSSVYVERDRQGQPARLVGVTRRLE